MKLKLLYLFLLLPFFGKSQNNYYSNPDSVFVGGIYEIPEIRFGFADYILFEDTEYAKNLTDDKFKVTSRDSLKWIVSFLDKNPTTIIKVENHTDCRGSDKYSMRLEYKRAQTVVDELIKMGIPNKRLIPVGMGKEEPIPGFECEKILALKTKPEIEKAHQKNRRTQIRVVSLAYKAPPKLLYKAFQDTLHFYDTTKLEIGNQFLIKRVRNAFNARINSEFDFDLLLDYLKTNNVDSVYIECHTDCRGSAAFNLMLTQKFSEILKLKLDSYNYPISFKCEGFGESQLIIPCEEIDKLATQEKREEAHQINRRIVINIISIKD